MACGAHNAPIRKNLYITFQLNSCNYLKSGPFPFSIPISISENFYNAHTFPSLSSMARSSKRDRSIPPRLRDARQKDRSIDQVSISSSKRGLSRCGSEYGSIVRSSVRSGVQRLASGVERHSGVQEDGAYRVSFGEVLKGAHGGGEKSMCYGRTTRSAKR